MPDFLQGEDIMQSIVFLMKSDAALSLANCSFIATGQAGSKLHNFIFMDIAQYFFIFGMSLQHNDNQSSSIIIKMVWNGLIISFLIQFKLMSQKSNQSSSFHQPKQYRKIGQYILGKTIGQGTFNKVKIARHIHTQEQVAVKMIDKRNIKNQADQHRLSKELKILRKARHPNIVQLYQILEDHHYFYLITEYASRGELFEHIVKYEKLTQFQASKFLQQLLNAVQYLHEIGVVHRDLKPENILLDYKYNVKIVDFGLSNIYSRGEMLNTACGSPCYAPPQMLAGKPYDPLKVDIWSIGIIVYAMCFGYLPFDHAESKELFNIIKEGKYELPSHASDELISLLKLILDVNPATRGTIYQIRNHKFCIFNRVPIVFGIIPGLSTIPYEPQLQQQIQQLGIDTSQLHKDIVNNKHNDNTATYYLLLQRWLRQRNQTKNNIINRYKLIEKVKFNYDKKLNKKISELEESRRLKSRSNKKKRSKTTDKKYHTGINSNSKSLSKNLFNTPTKKLSKDLNSIDSFHKKHKKSKSKKKLKRS